MLLITYRISAWDFESRKQFLLDAAVEAVLCSLRVPEAEIFKGEVDFKTSLVTLSLSYAVGRTSARRGFWQGRRERFMPVEPQFEAMMKHTPGLLLLRLSQLEPLGKVCDNLKSQLADTNDQAIRCELEMHTAVFRSEVGFEPEARREKAVEIRQAIQTQKSG